MTKHVKSSLVLLSGLLAGLLLIGGCAVPATTEQPQAAAGFDWTFLIFLVVIIAVFYFLMIRPQRTRQNQQRKMLNELKPGDRIVTLGGIYGEIESLSEGSVVLKIESGAKIRVSRQSIAGIQPEEGPQ